jgi:hypothetical protein
MNSNLKNLTRAAFLLAIAIIFQLIGRTFSGVSQILVGPAVNAILILAASICGLWYGVAVGVLTPVLAWILGQLAPPLAPFIPFIIIGNILFVVLYYNFRKVNKYGDILGIIIGAIFKFLFLYLSATKIVIALKLFTNPKIIKTLSVAMGVLQLITALIGGIIALMLLKLLKNKI